MNNGESRTDDKDALLKRASGILSREFGDRFPEEAPDGLAQWFLDYDRMREQQPPIAVSAELPSDMRQRLEDWKQSMGVMVRRGPCDPGFVAIYQDMQRALAGRSLQSHERSAVAEQEPVAWRWRDDGSKNWRYHATGPTHSDAYDIEPLYGHPWSSSAIRRSK
jgi:hypothetical protein